MSNFKALLQRVKYKDFSYHNSSITEYIAKRNSGEISYSARYMIIKAMMPSFKEYWHPILISFWYCFTETTPDPGSTNHLFKFNMGGILDIDVTLESGTVHADKKENTYIICGSKSAKLGKELIKSEECLHGLIPGFSFHSH